ncbi:MAG: DegT/DnrJ/EryC1/StrS aminotransferase family protein [Rhodospirillaceae bacterium]|nr:DegT/DnrJ/EryC1/StrS aminotransferase family protein [Rhodospirillaceae bacterium]
MTPETAAQVLSKRTKAVIVVHLAGWPADMTALMAFAATQNLKVIEDCAQAHGASELGRPVGGIGHIGCFSFCQDKIISTGGEGGMVVTSDITLYKKMWATRDHGKDFDRATTKSMAAESGPHFKWMVDSFGTNARMTEAQAAIGRLQLKKLPQWRAQRQANAAALTAALRGSNAVTVPQPDAQHVHAYYKFYALVTPGALKSGWSRDRICAELQRRGVPAGSGACPDISREAAFASFGAQAPHPGAAEIAERTLMLPVHPTLTRGNVAFMAETVRQILNEAAR